MMQTNVLCRASLSLVLAVSLAGCTSQSSDIPPSTPSSSAAAQPGSSSAAGTRGGGGPGGVLQPITAVTLNINGTGAGGANTAAVSAAATKFLASLDDAQRGKVEYDFSDNQARQTWSNFPSTAVPREGIALSELSTEQLQSAYALLQTALSSNGFQQDGNIQKADDYLGSLGGQGADGFGALKDYYLAVYGQPSTTTPFMVQFGGHHLARNLTYNGDEVSQTPQFVGSEPTSFQVDGKTITPVAAESMSVFGALAALTPEQRATAEITSGTFDDLLMGPGKDSGNFPAAEGLSVAGLNTIQRDAVIAAIRSYAGDLNDTASAKLMAKYTNELDDTRIGWSNNTGPTEENSYVRIDGPSVWIEFINTRSQSTPDIHYHSVYRDKANDYGSSKPG